MDHEGIEEASDETYEQFAALSAPDDTRYIIMCPECHTAWYRKQDCKTTKAVRSGAAECPKDGADLYLALDAKDDSDDD